MKNSILLLMASLLMSCATVSKNKTSDSKKKDYWAYYELCLQARDSFDLMNYAAASLLFEQAFEMVDNPSYHDLNKAIETASILHENGRIEDYAFILAKKYALYPTASKVQDTTLYQEIKKTVEPIILETKATFDSAYVEAIHELFKKDVKARTGGGIIYKDGINIDSIHTYKLLALIKEKGFPSIDKVGLESYSEAGLIWTHADFDIDNKLLGDLLYNAVGKGEYSPGDYASIIDRRCNYTPKRFYYFQIPIGYDELSVAEKKEVTERRRKIGLRTVDQSLTITILPTGDMRIFYKN